MKKIWLAICCILAVFSFSVAIPVAADSGWDTDYGGSSDWGGSSSSDWSSSDWGSSSSSRDSYSWHSDHSYSGSGDGYSMTKEDERIFVIVMIVIVAIVFGFVILNAIDNSRRKKEGLEAIRSYIGDSDFEIKKFFPNLDERTLIDVLFQRFVDVQVAWMNFDYDKLRELCTDELYNSYKSDLEILKSMHGQNIMSNFVMYAANINGMSEENGLVIIRMYLHVAFYDYVVDVTNGLVTKGSNTHKVHNQYVLEFVVARGQTITKCPSCGADINSGDSHCSYCHTPIINDYETFVLSKKSKVNE